MYGLIWWEAASANLPVSYPEAVRMAREAKSAVEGAGLGGFEEVGLDPDDDVEAGEDEPPEAWADPAAAGSVGGETGVSNGDDVGDGGREAVAAGEAEDGSQIDGEEARSEEVAPSGDDAMKSAAENETGVDGEATAGPKEGQPNWQATAEVRRAVEDLAEGMTETVPRGDCLADGRRVAGPPRGQRNDVAGAHRWREGPQGPDPGVREG